MDITRSAVALAVVTACTVGACGGDEPAKAPLTPALGLEAPAYEAGAAQARAEFRYGDGGSRGLDATVEFVNDEPRTCGTQRRDRLLRFSLSVGPDEIGTGRSGDKVRLRTGPIGRRAGDTGYEARIIRQVVEIGGAGTQAPGAGGGVRLGGDLRSGDAVIGAGDERVSITFRC